MNTNDPGAFGSGKSVLLADDDDGLREALAMHLESRGFLVFPAKDGEEALTLAQEHFPNIAILDIAMPKRNGWNVARAIRAEPSLHAVRILMLSGIGTDVLGPNLEVLGGDMGLDKPFELDQLDEALQLLMS